jgi:hypothetical protein
MEGAEGETAISAKVVAARSLNGRADERDDDTGCYAMILVDDTAGRTTSKEAIRSVVVRTCDYVDRPIICICLK